jgi:hypothetical protein
LSQVLGVPAAQLPVPLHTSAGVYVTPEQVDAAHIVPAAYRRQPPAPSHAPSVPQPGAPLSAQWSRGSAPAGTGAQVPRLPASAHERHVPVQLELQQTPCWQRPEAHSAPPAHAVPSTFFAHCVPMQTLGATQSASVAQARRQLPFVPHRNGSQGTTVGVWQTPVPLHVCGGVYVACVQLSAPQVVPLAYRRQPPTPSQAPSVPQLAAP